MQSYLTEFWKDHRLNLSGYLSEIEMGFKLPTELVKKLWVPDLVFDNMKHGVLFDLSQPNTYIEVLPSGFFCRWSRFVTKLILLINIFVDILIILIINISFYKIFIYRVARK